MPAREDQKGHRERLRQRFLADNDALPDYELLELILFHAIPRRDTKPLAKALIDRFGSLQAVLAADSTDLRQAVEGVGDTAVVVIKACHEAGRRLAKADIRDRALLGSWEQVLDYCRAELAHGGVERFHVLYLDRKNRLIAAMEQSRGTIDQTSVYPREVVKEALGLGASALIMVHNHPSGDPAPSEADIAITRAMRAAGEAVGIVLHDHIVIARGSHVSLRSAGHL